MNRMFLSALIAMCVLLTSAVVSAQVKVAATLPTIAAIAKDVGGEHVKVTSLSSPQQDPHYVDPRPNLLVSLSQADLLLLNGLELEVGWLPPLLVNARNQKIQPGSRGYVDVSTVVDRLNVRGSVSRAEGDVHPGGNPHFLTDPRAAVAAAELIKNRLIQVDPDNTKAYEAGYADFRKRISKIAKDEFVRFSKIAPETRQLVVYHDSWQYLLNWLHVKQVITVEPKPGIMPTPGHVAKVLSTMRKTKTKVIIQESYYPSKTSQNLAKLAKANLVVLDGGVDFDNGDTYEAYVKRVAGAVYEGLK